jgi:hypothetical protein
VPPRRSATASTAWISRPSATASRSSKSTTTPTSTGVEDAYLGEDLYRRIMEEFLRRLERKRLGITD